MELIAFYGFASLAIVSALFILLSKNLIYSAFALFVTFLGVAALYVLAGADFLAVTQIMIYVGGILVLLIFGIMLTQQTNKRAESTSANQVLAGSSRRVPAFIIAMATFLFFSLVIVSANFRIAGNVNLGKSTIKTIGVELMTSHLLPFEIAGILLLVALIGAAYLALNRNPSHE
ncbi:NADH-quinone oxidoreductase subunit J [Dyadobacter jejuensis]|uniref:NADH-quinone oxidoreductase subunit J n=1 Tax=Dyadobacter jejuensis TaxID=1082580 RepID=A0A316BBT1_9BACT|nr:NADH-quinone oxidoreductase subunit J [Dyadobacter jejuensis]PWJ59937.1 NADH-quinone oxidoreductase subunit J [Dyadobacter jejuensis]